MLFTRASITQSSHRRIYSDQVQSYKRHNRIISAQSKFKLHSENLIKFPTCFDMMLKWVFLHSEINVKKRIFERCQKC